LGRERALKKCSKKKTNDRIPYSRPCVGDHNIRPRLQRKKNAIRGKKRARCKCGFYQSDKNSRKGAQEECRPSGSERNCKKCGREMVKKMTANAKVKRNALRLKKPMKEIPAEKSSWKAVHRDYNPETSWYAFIKLHLAKGVKWKGGEFILGELG